MDKNKLGHWKIEKSPFEVFNVDHGSLTHEICDEYTLIAALYVDHDSFAATLLAAAPELLEALEHTQALLERLGMQSSDEYQANAAAIAKAKGETK